MQYGVRIQIRQKVLTKLFCDVHSHGHDILLQLVTAY